MHKLLKISQPDTKLQEILIRELGISKILSQLLINRGINGVDEASQFLDANISHLLDPFAFSDMHKAVSLIKKAINNKERIMLFGDYDVDGITALTLLKDTLSKMGVEPLHYIPHRVKEGYSLNKNALNLARQRGIKLLITADCGISSFDEIKELRKHNIEVIITDHHEPSREDLPVASAVINPKLKSSGYKFRDLAGVGVAYKLCQALTKSVLLEELDLVSLGTISDMVPLSGENRVIAKEGLSRIRRTSRIGLKALIEMSGLKNKKINSTCVSYIIAPRINASGRMDTAEIALNLLLSQKQEEADGLVRLIETHNRQRQKVESKIMDEAQDLIAQINFKEEKVIVLAKEDWHLGVLGIVASKLADRFYRPTIMISLGESSCRGSGRSIKNFHLFQALLECQNFLEAFGGHSHAVGLVINKDNIGDFKAAINRIAMERLHFEDLIPSLEVDMEISLADLDEEAIRELERLEPFGSSNPEPLFYTRNLRLKGEPKALSRDTLKFWVSDGKITTQAIGFGMASSKESLMAAEAFDMVYNGRMDNWQGEEAIILEAKDIFFK